jgi:hypothetical protein
MASAVGWVNACDTHHFSPAATGAACLTHSYRAIYIQSFRRPVLAATTPTYRKMATVTFRLAVAATIVTLASGCSFYPDSAASALEKVSRLVNSGMSKSVAIDNLRKAGITCVRQSNNLDCTYEAEVCPLTSCTNHIVLVLNEQSDTIAAIAAREPACFGGFG